MQEIEELNQKFKTQRKTATIFVGSLVVTGLALTLPLWNDSIKWTETLYCFSKVKNEECDTQSIKRGITWIIDQERRNFLFDTKVTFIRVMPPEDDSAPMYGSIGAICLLIAYGVSKSLTDSQEKAIHSQFALLKAKALENDIIVSNHLEVTEFAQAQQTEITKTAIARETAQVIDEMKSPEEQALDQINGQLQGQVALKQHELTISEMEKQIAENELSTAETKKKLEKVSKPAGNGSATQATSSLVNAIKNHEDGWLWTVIKAVKPLWIIGEQGTGKTNTAVAIGLIRKYCLGVPVFRIADRHLNGANSKVWALLEAQNKADNDSAIIEVLQDTYERRLERISQDLDDKQAEQFLLDEFTHLRDIADITVGKFVKSTFSDTRKAKERFIGVTHLGTNEAFGERTAAMRKAGSILIEKFTADGEKPLARVMVKHGLVDSQGNKLEDVEHTLPSWFEAFTIYQHFHGKPLNLED